MSKASEAQLGDLHGEVARLLTDVISNGVQVSEREDGTAVRATAPAAYVVAALAMLKQNNITADAGTNEALNGLSKMLADKRKAGKAGLSQATLEEAMGALERDLAPGFVQ